MKKHKDGHCKDAKNVDDLLATLKKQDGLPQISICDNAVTAVRENNKAQLAAYEADNSAEVVIGGNKEQYDKVAGEAVKQAVVTEDTFTNFTSDSGQEFVALTLIKHWSREGEEGKKSPLLSPDFGKMAVSNRGHPKVYNIIQTIYVESKTEANQME